MNWKIAVDSSSDLHEGLTCAPNVSLSIVPLIVQVGDMSFVDEPDLDMNVFLNSMRTASGPTGSSCPSPAAWSKVFEEADYTIALTISSALSGSYSAAMVARDLVMDEHPNKKIAVIDTRSVSGQMILVAQKINELIAQGLSFEEVVHGAEDYNKTLNIYFTLSSFDNLTKNGRMPKLAGVVAKKLGMRIIGTSDEGNLSVIHKCRGDRSTMLTLLKDMKDACDLSKRHVIISHCSNLKGAMTLQNLLETEAPGVQVSILPTHALTSYYAEDQGLIISF